MNTNNDLILKNVKARENALFRNVYLWMTVGLAITAAVSYGLSQSATFVRFFYTNPVLTIIAFIVEIALVMVLSARIEKLSTGSAIAIFVAYAAVTGMTFTSIFLAYTGVSIASAFLSATAVFAAGAVYGTVTKKSLKNWSGYLFMGLIGLLIASLVNMFLRSSSFDFIISIIGVLLFVGLTAWDSQKISDMNNTFGSVMSKEELTKISILGALDLYLDFLNIFLYLLRLFGRSSDK